MPLVASSTSPYVSGLSPQGRLTSAATARPSFYGAPLVAWQPALGADQYQVQWSKTQYPWVTKGEKFTYATSALLTARARGLVLPRPRRQLLAAGHCPRDVVVGAGRAEGREADLRGRQEVRSIGSRGCEPADLELALSLADDADAITLPRFRAHDLRVETKPDLTPVSEADRAAEAALRERLARERPGEAVLGEEEGGEDASGWILDPIDGTRNYTRGIPVWATLIAYADRIAVVSAPALGRRWWAERGAGAFLDGSPIHVSAIDRLEDATVLYGLERPPPARAYEAWHIRGFGDFWAHMLVAEGAAEAAFDASGLAIWDWAPMKILVEEAGGRYEESVSWNGRLDVSELR